MRFAPQAQGVVSSYGAMHHHPNYVDLPVLRQLKPESERHSDKK